MALTQALIDDIDTAFDINGDKQNVEIRNAFQALLNGGVGSALVYKAIITQDGVLAPFEDDIDNNWGGSPFVDTLGGTWSYTAVGDYKYTKVGAFTDATKINVELGVNSRVVQYDDQITFERIDNDSIRITSTSVASWGGIRTLANDTIVTQPITIEVYP